MSKMAPKKIYTVEIVQMIVEMHKNNRLLNSTLKLQNQCMEVILANKKAICILAAQTETNPMDKLTTLARMKLSLKAMQYKSQSGDDFKSTCQLLAMLVSKDTNNLKIPLCQVSCCNPKAQSDFAQLEKFTKSAATKATSLEKLELEADVLIPLASLDPVARSIFTRRICQLRNLRVLNVMSMTFNNNSLQLIASHLLLLTNLTVSIDLAAFENHRPGFEALSQLRYLNNFHFVPWLSEISQTELELVNMCMILMPGLKTIGRNLNSFNTHKIEMLGCLRTSYHSVPALQSHALQIKAPALEEFYTYSTYWTAETARLIPNLMCLHIVLDNDHIPDTLQRLSLYYVHNLQRVRAFTPNLTALTLFSCNLSSLPLYLGGLLAQCPNLNEMHLIDCFLFASNVALHDDICSRSLLQVLNYRGKIGVRRGFGVVSRLLQAPMLRYVGISVPSIALAEVQLLVRQLRFKSILQKAELLCLEGEGMQPLATAVQVYLPKAVLI